MRVGGKGEVGRMKMLWMPVLAQAGTGPGGASGGSMVVIVGYMAIIFAIFYFMVILPQRRRDKERKKLIESVKTGDRILFGGILGTVANVKEFTLIVKVADNVKMEIIRGAVQRVVEKDSALAGVEVTQ